VTISEKANELIDELGITDPKDLDIEAIAYHARIEVRYKSMVGCEASLIGFKDNAIVTIGDSMPWRRQRFSIAHEIGHWQLHRGETFNCRSDDFEFPIEKKPPKEKVADVFAAELLMPISLFRPLANRIQYHSFESIKTLSEAFDTSLVSTALRVIDMDVAPLILINHTKDGRLWFRVSKMAKQWFPRPKLQKESVADNILFGGKIDNGHQQISADLWFDKQNASQFEIYEHSKRYNNGVLTLLTLTSKMTEDDEPRGRYLEKPY